MMCKLGSILSGLFLVSCVFAASAEAQAVGSRPTGLVVVKEFQSDKDEFAKSFHFVSFTKFGVTTNFNIGTSSPLIVENFKICAIAEFGDLETRDLITPEDRKYLQFRHDEFQELTKRFPTVRGKLKPVVESILSDIAQLDAGQIRYRGGWASKISYDNMVQNQKQAADSEAKKYSDALEDRKKREQNLSSLRKGLAARWLINGYGDYVTALKSVAVSKSGGLGLELPQSMVMDPVPLPKHAWKEIGLKEGKGIFSPAFMYVQGNDGIRSFRLAFVITYEEGGITNPTELQGALNVLSQIDDSLASWLPTAVVSGSAKLEFLRNTHHQGSKVNITREIAGRECELDMTVQATHDDGTSFSIVCLTVQ